LQNSRWIKVNPLPKLSRLAYEREGRSRMARFLAWSSESHRKE